MADWFGWVGNQAGGAGGGVGGRGLGGGTKPEPTPSAGDVKATKRTVTTVSQMDRARIVRPSPSSIVPSTSTNRDQLEDQNWYHGLLPRQEINSLLEKEGDWLVRSTEKETGILIVISVKWKGDFKHIILNRTDKGWTMPQKNFESVPQLVEYFVQTKEPINDFGVTLAGRYVSRKNWLVSSKDVKCEQKIGEGNFGEVFLGKLRMKDRWVPVAIKTCKALVAKNDKEEFMKEAKIMLQYKHPNVVRIFAVAADKPPLMLIMEHCSGGGLNRYLTKNKPVNIETKCRLCYEAARGMEYLACEKNCIHRDLAARNVLLGPKLDVKIADFGLTRQGTYQMSEKSTHQVPVRWTAPEALLTGRFSKETDVWSFGILVWEILNDADQPWPNKTVKEAFKAMRAGEKMDIPNAAPVEMKTLVYSMWDMDPSLRPNMQEIRKALEKIHADVRESAA